MSFTKTNNVVFQELHTILNAEKGIDWENCQNTEIGELLTSSTYSLWFWNMQNNKQYLCPGHQKMFGYKKDEIPANSEPWKKFVVPDDEPQVADSFKNHVDSSGKAPFQNEVRFRHKNGATMKGLCAGQITHWSDDGQPVRMVGIHVEL